MLSQRLTCESDDSESCSVQLVILRTESFGQHDSLLNVSHGEENGGEHSRTEAAPSIQTCHCCRFNNSSDSRFGGMESSESGGRRGRGEVFIISSVTNGAAVWKLAGFSETLVRS